MPKTVKIPQKPNRRVARKHQPGFSGEIFIMGEGLINMCCEVVAETCPKTGRVVKGPWPALTIERLPKPLAEMPPDRQGCGPFSERQAMIVFKDVESLKNFSERLMYCYSLGKEIAEKKPAKGKKRKTTKKAK